MNNSPWINNIPNEWKCEKVKYHFKYSKNKNTDSDVNLLSLTLNGVIENSLENPNGMLPSDISTYQKVKRDSLIFKLIDLENIKTSRVGICPKDGIMSSAYINLETSQNAHYMYYQFFNMYNNLVFNKLGSGVRSTLSHTDLLNMDMLIPSEKEQNKIANFLDDKIVKIDEVISSLLKLNSYLDNAKQNYIDQKIEFNKNVIKVKYFATVIKSNIEYSNYVGLENIVKNENKYIASETLYDGEFNSAHKGSLILGKLRPNLKKVWILEFNSKVSKEFMVLNSPCNAYLMYTFMSSKYTNDAVNQVYGSKMPRINSDFILNYEIPNISYNEMVAISEDIKKYSTQIYSLKAKNEKKLELLQEYKKVLINDAVTGKIKIGDEYVK